MTPCTDPQCKGSAHAHTVGAPRCSSTVDAQPCTNKHCALLPPHRFDNPGCTTFINGPSRHDLIVARQQRELDAKRRPEKRGCMDAACPLHLAHAFGSPGCRYRPHDTSPLEALQAAVREYLDAEVSRTSGAYNLQVKGAARARMLTKEVRRVDAARDALKKLVGL